MPGREGRTAAWSLVALGGAAFVLLLWAYWPYTVDDTFIFLRYAKNLAGGAGLTWNPGLPPVEGYTSFSWTVLLALPAALGLDGLAFAKVAGALLMLAAAAAAARLTLELTGDAPAGRLVAAVAAFTFIAAPATAIHAVAGMETALATALVTTWTWLAVRFSKDPAPRTAWALALAGLGLGLTRPEANLFVGVGLAALAVQAPREAKLRLGRAAGIALVLPGAAYFAWRAVRYGHLLPLPFYVKTLAHDAGPLAGWPECFELLRDFTVERPWLFIPLAVTAATRPVARALLLPIGAWWAFFIFPEHQMGFDLRYLYPLIPTLLAFAAAGLLPFIERLPERLRPGLVAALTVVLTVATAYGHLRGSVREKRDYGAGGVRSHLPIGQWLASIRPRVERPIVATLDAGAIGYFSGWTVIDTWGLNDPEIALAAAGKGRDADAILARDPAVVIVISAQRDTFVPQFAFEGPLYQRALAGGFRHLSTYEFLPDYFLWVLASPRVPDAEPLK